MAKARSSGRRQEILETLARMLEEQQGEHITTAGLAKARLIRLVSHARGLLRSGY